MLLWRSRLPSRLPLLSPHTLCRSGDPAADWDLLQRISFSNPEAFWPHVLRLLRIRFHKLPHRWETKGAQGSLTGNREQFATAAEVVTARLLVPASPAARLVNPSALQYCIADCIFCTAGRVLELGPDADSCVWLPGARLNIAECALTGKQL